MKEGKRKIKALEKQILALVSRSSEKISLCNLPRLFESKFKQKLAYKSLGYKTLGALICALPSLEVHGLGGGSSCFICPSQKRAITVKDKREAENEPSAKPGSISDSDSENVKGVGVVVVETLGLLEYACNELKNVDVAIDCEGVPEKLYLIQVCAIRKPASTTFVFDCVRLDPVVVCAALEHVILANPYVVKYFHDLHKDVLAMSRIGRVGPELHGAFDTQLAAEAINGHIHVGFNAMLELFGQGQQHSTKKAMQRKMNQDRELFAKRPLPNDVLLYAALDVELLASVVGGIRDNLGEYRWLEVQQASDRRVKSTLRYEGARRIRFDVTKAYQMRSFEFLKENSAGSIMKLSPIDVVNDVDSLLAALPADLTAPLRENEDLANLTDIVLDIGRTPYAWLKRQRFFLREQVVTKEEIDAIVEKVGHFGGDNRGGLERELHRISAIRNRSSDIIGLTMRVGRQVIGTVDNIADLLFSDPEKSILFLGEPGSGKTTLLREATRLLSNQFNVCIVDTSNEIAGDGDIPHPCVGHARRMMVPSLNAQRSTMIECVQNHSPQVMVIDEIGRTTEVEAARTCKQRGVRLVASAHGSLRKLVKNQMLRGLVGGVTSVVLGDEEARLASPGSPLQKIRAQRTRCPIFDIVIELKAGQRFAEYDITNDVGLAVDRILGGGKYHIQKRKRHTDGAFLLELDSA